jgi:hypothetical protein
MRLAMHETRVPAWTIAAFVIEDACSCARSGLCAASPPRCSSVLGSSAMHSPLSFAPQSVNLTA